MSTTNSSALALECCRLQLRLEVLAPCQALLLLGEDVQACCRLRYEHHEQLCPQHSSAKTKLFEPCSLPGSAVARKRRTGVLQTAV